MHLIRRLSRSNVPIIGQVYPGNLLSKLSFVRSKQSRYFRARASLGVCLLLSSSVLT